MPTRAGSYARQSAAKHKSITEQTEEIRTAAADEGWTIVAEYSDGASASRFARKARDGWPKVLDDIAARRIDVLILWESSRGDRTPETWFAFLSSCRESGVRIHVVTHERTYRLENPRDWRTLAEDGIDSAYESDKTSLRARRGQAGAAAAGRPTPGRTQYGYRRVYDPDTGRLAGQVADPDTAPIVADIVDQVAAGTPISTIADRLNAAAIAAPGGGRWHRVRVRDIASNPAYVGLRRHHGSTTAAAWPPIVSETSWWAAQRILSDPTRRTSRPGRWRHLLSYLMRCDQCEGPPCVARGRYRCEGCGATIVQPATDAFVEAVVLGWLARPDVHERLRSATAISDAEVIEAEAEAARLRGELDGWRRSAIAGRTSPESLAVIEAGLTDRIRAAESRTLAAGLPPELRDLLAPGEDVAARWAAAGIPPQRVVIRTVADVRFAAGRRGGARRFDPWRLGPSRWVGDVDGRTWGDYWREAGLPS
ncbi:recombinase family protein [Solwaraspora sp. WMMD792]|uniref:recombinase family protein n=1 Tax=Solwaraspora sp. WMMD792 TaxID=3016099 RepID=UPI002415C6CC|nr:recombinase family protein [Solwaraspora sp. WMMD792]MDG4768864.1 recombinase family protein [Solwaraspora sp. WMMD792]MDG4769035.1 recombinase family protein [Solwaraspora sp. WMMD792]